MAFKVGDYGDPALELAKGIPAAVEAFYDARHNKMKELAMQAKMKAEERERVRQIGEDRMRLEKEGYAFPEGEVTDPMGMLARGELGRKKGYLSNEDLDRQYKQSQIRKNEAEIKSKRQTFEKEKTKQKEVAKKQEQKKKDVTMTSQNIVTDIDKAINRIMDSDFSSGPLAGQTSILPGTPAYELDKILTTLKANVGFDKLQKMREMSPTGGALGQVSENELRFLQSTSGNIDVDTPDELLLDYLKRIRKVYEAYEKDFGQGVGVDMSKDNKKGNEKGIIPIPGESGGGVQTFKTDELDFID